ncbi:hypothetical protein ABW19_dt0201423 [Dactylella cylindrospora]|nr:hypothetical protein ABW19_dt0201423 [Dactylella cylindrospora]
MFYDHRILTQRKYGVATVWLVATIGSKSSLSKKVHKKEILEVDLAKACRTIVQSENPLALRLQSNLLFGVSRVFFEQYNYLFTDVANAHQRISRDIFINLDTGKIDLVGARIRPEALLLQDDPTFVPELAFIIPEYSKLPEDQLNAATQLSFEDKTILASERPGSVAQSIRSGASPFGQLIVPDSSSLEGVGIGIQPFLGDDLNAQHGPEEQIDDDIGFIFDENGELQDLPARVGSVVGDDFGGPIEDIQEDAPAEFPERRRWDSTPAASDRVREEHERGKAPNANLNFVNLGDLDNYANPEGRLGDGEEAEPFPFRRQILDNENDKPTSRNPAGRVRLAQVDESIELGSSQLVALGSSYLANMEQARQKKSHIQSLNAAKKAAIGYIYGWNGMLRSDILQSRFEGMTILQLLYPDSTHEPPKKTQGIGRKRAIHEAELDDGSQGSQIGRRVRGDFSERQIDDEFALPADDMEAAGFDEQVNDPVHDIQAGHHETNLKSEQDVEVARRASSQTGADIMPWNIPKRGSRAGSVVSLGGFGTSSVGGVPSSVNRMYSSASRRIISPAVAAGTITGRRVGRATPTPLAGIARAALAQVAGTPDFEDLADLYSNNELTLDEEPIGDPAAPEGGLGDHEGTASAKETQNSQWLAEMLERESQNFFEYLEAQIIQKYGDMLYEEDAIRGITFEELVEPNHSSNVVAAQAFHHTLHLATRGAIRVTQAECFGEITIRITT